MKQSGYLTVVLPRDLQQHAAVSEIYIAKNLRGKGYGQKLYLAAAAEAKKMGYPGLKSSLVTSRSDLASRAWASLTNKGKAKRVQRDRFAFDVIETREVNHCHGPGKGHPCEHGGTQEFLTRYPQYAPEVETFAQKYGDARLHNEIESFWSNQRKGSSVPSMAFQLEVMQAGAKRQSAEKRAAKGRAATALKDEALRQIAAQGWNVGDTFFDSESGTKAVLKVGRDGRPYFQSALGKHPTSRRWQRVSV